MQTKEAARHVAGSRGTPYGDAGKAAGVLSSIRNTYSCYGLQSISGTAADDWLSQSAACCCTWCLQLRHCAGWAGHRQRLQHDQPHSKCELNKSDFASWYRLRTCPPFPKYQRRLAWLRPVATTDGAVAASPGSCLHRQHIHRRKCSRRSVPDNYPTVEPVLPMHFFTLPCHMLLRPPAMLS